MEYKDNEGMENILILSKNSIKTFSERTGKYMHPFGTLKKISFKGLCCGKLLITS